MKLDELVNRYIKIDLDLLIKEGITPTAYVWMYLLHKNDNRCFNEFKLNTRFLNNLEERDYISIGQEVRLLPKGLNLFEEDDMEKKFLELWNLFPREVPNGKGGIRLLRASSPESRNADVSKTKYFEKIKGKPGLHDKIITCLKKQLQIEIDSLQYMNNIETWIHQQIWEKYEDIEETKTDFTEDI